jgi:hypothetical protein
MSQLLTVRLEMENDELRFAWMSKMPLSQLKFKNMCTAAARKLKAKPESAIPISV